MVGEVIYDEGGSSSTADVNDDKDDNQNTDSGESDSGDTAVDTAPPPPCPLMEEEPNGDFDTAQIVQMEKWICGTFDEASDSAADLDVFSFTTSEEGWVKMWARGQDIGSSADLMLTIKIGNETALSTFSMGSFDPVLTIPVEEGVTVFAAIQDQSNTPRPLPPLRLHPRQGNEHARSWD